MVKYKVVISAPAEKDLQAIVSYISSQLSVSITALQMVDAFEEAMVTLAEMPHRYELVHDESLASMGYRKLLIKNYIVFFVVDERSNTVEIHRILYARRDWMRLLGEGS